MNLMSQIYEGLTKTIKVILLESRETKSQSLFYFFFDYFSRVIQYIKAHDTFISILS